MSLGLNELRRAEHINHMWFFYYTSNIQQYLPGTNGLSGDSGGYFGQVPASLRHRHWLVIDQLSYILLSAVEDLDHKVHIRPRNLLCYGKLPALFWEYSWYWYWLDIYGVAWISMVAANGLAPWYPWHKLGPWFLTHWGLVTPYGIGDLGQHWFR